MATLTVGPTSTYPSVAAAMAAAAAGDTIVIQAGYGPETATVLHNSMIFTGPGNGLAQPRVTLQLGTGVTTVFLAGSTPLDVLDNALDNTIVSTDTSNNQITVTDGADTVSGSGFGSGDTLFVDYRLATGNVTGTWSAGFSEAGGTRSVAITGGATFEAMDIRTGSGIDDLRGAGSGFGSLEGWAGNDRLEGTTRWTLNGGPGADTLIFTDQAQVGSISYAWASAGVTANLLNPLANTGDAAGDSYVYTGVVELIGSVFGDTLTLDNGGGALHGVQGDDTLIGGTGNDDLFGAAGLNHLIGGAGANSLNGVAGLSFADYSTAASGVIASLVSPGGNTGDAAGDSYVQIFGGLIGSAFADVLTLDNNSRSIWALYGDDTLFGGSGNDDLHGQDGNDMLIGGGGTNHLDGGAGGDLLEGAGGLSFASYATATAGVAANMAFPSANTGDAVGDTYVHIRGLIGSNLDDFLRLEATAGSIWAMDGNDFAVGGAGNDDLHGQGGINHLRGGPGADLLDGSGGWSFADYTTSTSGVVVNMANPTANTGEAAGDSFQSMRGLVGSAFDDTLTLGSSAGSIWAMDGNDLAIGGAGNDDLHGELGINHLIGGAGADTLDGSAGWSFADYSTAAAGVVADMATPSANTGDAAGDVYQSLRGLVGSAFDDTLQLAGGAVSIWALGGNDTATGGAGGDDLHGQDGNDTLNGVGGLDTLEGGAGDDTFVFGRGEANGDTVLDFAGNGAGAGDSLLFSGYGTTGATFTQVDATHWSINSSDGLTQDIVTFANGPSIDASDWQFV